MEFIDQASSGKNNFFSYLTGTLIILGLFLLGNSALFFYLNFQFPNEPIDSWTQSKITASLGKTELLFWLTFPFALVFFGLIFHINKVHGRTISSIFTGKEKFNWKRTFFSFGLVFGILALSLVVQSFFGHDLKFQFDINKFLPLLVVSLIMLSIQTTCEEVIFRSYLLQGFKNRLRINKAAVLISGIMFGAIHIGNPEIQVIGYHILVYYIVVGIFLGLITLFDNGMELAIGYHAANNIFAAIVVTNDWQAFQTDAIFLDTSQPGFAWDVLLGIFVVLPFIFYVFSKKYNWQSLKEKWNG
jgi:membrane protease YdiL (CAAX protease family)